MKEKQAVNACRKFELFSPISLNTDTLIHSTVLKTYKQERDWTCSIACLRTMMSANPTILDDEGTYITRYNLKPGPYYSKDIKRLGILSGKDVIFGCDDNNTTNIPKRFDDLLRLMKNNYNVMVECLYNYAHWLVILMYYPGDSPEDSKLTVYDPYYDKIRNLITDEFLSMWIDMENRDSIIADYIALKV